MEKYITRIYGILILIGLCISIFAAVKPGAAVFTESDAIPAEDWTGKMNMEHTASGLVYTAVLPDNQPEGCILAFDTYHTEAEVSVGDTIIYSVKHRDGSFTRTTGFRWNYISLKQEYSGQPVTIRIHSIYKNQTISEPSVYYGKQTPVSWSIVKKDLVHFMVSLLILVLGLAMFFYAYFIAGKKTEHTALKHFTIFTVLLGIWVVCDSSLSMLIIPYHVALSFLVHISLMLMPIPFLLFVRTTCQDKEHPLWYVYCYFNCAIVIIRMVLQLLGIRDFLETLWMTHVSLMLFLCVGCYLCVRELLTGRATAQMRINIAGIILILATTFVDLLYYKLTSKSSTYGAIGFLLYTIIMGIATIRRSRRILEMAQENEIYRRLAFTDELTGLFNRTAFNRDLKLRETELADGQTQIEPTAIFMFDLNNLKKCNDGYGHDCGDLYLTTASSIIERTFETEGRCYRIGGDEFCVVIPFVSRSDILNHINVLRRKIREQNNDSFVVPIEIATGYAIYDPSIDHSLSDTKKRADEAMYHNKEKLKNTD